MKFTRGKGTKFRLCVSLKRKKKKKNLSRHAANHESSLMITNNFYRSTALQFHLKYDSLKQSKKGPITLS